MLLVVKLKDPEYICNIKEKKKKKTLCIVVV